jgi:hypothetical protein
VNYGNIPAKRLGGRPPPLCLGVDSPSRNWGNAALRDIDSADEAIPRGIDAVPPSVSALTLPAMSLVSEDRLSLPPRPVPATIIVPSVAPSHEEARKAGARRAKFYDSIVKPAMDFVGAALLLVSLTPVLLMVALAVRARLGPGVIYRQQRVGRGGKAFTMFKFRSMEPDRRTAQLPFEGFDRRVSHKRDDDPRHTSLGRFLRRTRLDELPAAPQALPLTASISTWTTCERCRFSPTSASSCGLSPSRSAEADTNRSAAQVLRG